LGLTKKFTDNFEGIAGDPNPPEAGPSLLQLGFNLPEILRDILILE
jgi:hypothetical protein